MSSPALFKLGITRPIESFIDTCLQEVYAHSLSYLSETHTWVDVRTQFVAGDEEGRGRMWGKQIVKKMDTSLSAKMMMGCKDWDNYQATQAHWHHTDSYQNLVASTVSLQLLLRQNSSCQSNSSMLLLPCGGDYRTKASCLRRQQYFINFSFLSETRKCHLNKTIIIL